MSGPEIGALHAGTLAVADGLLALVRPALHELAPGGELFLTIENQAALDDLAVWCKVEHHELLAEAGAPGTVRIRRGGLNLPRGLESPGPLALAQGRLTAEEVLRVAPLPERADPATGFAPRGSLVEPGGPGYPFTLNDRAHTTPPDVARLYDQAVAAQWDAEADIAWHKIRPLARPLERALGQVMTFLAENELSALYVPSKFIARLHPHFVETGMMLATIVADEARHIDVFLKRARVAGGSLGVSHAVTSASLHSLLVLEDFTEAEFLLSVLGEGTFLDLLRFIEDHAPDEPTADLVRRARNDEARHVHFGMSHVRHALAQDPSVFARLEAAVRRRAASLAGVASVPALVQDSLTVLAARSNEPGPIRRGHEKFRELLHVMHENRVKRLETAGFSPEQAAVISDLHTPNFM